MSYSLRPRGPRATFWVFTGGAGLSDFGTWFNTVAVALLVFRLTGQPDAVATTVVISIIPRVALTLFAGALADRFDRLKLLIVLDLLNTLVAFSPLLVHERSQLPIVFGNVFLLQVMYSLYRPAQQAYLAELSLKDEWSAEFMTISDVVMSIGPSIAGLICALYGTSFAFALNGATYFFSALILSRLPRHQEAMPAGVSHGARIEDASSGVVLPFAPAPQGLEPASALSEPRQSVLSLLLKFPEVMTRAPIMVPLFLLAAASCIPVYFFYGIIVSYAARLGSTSLYTGLSLGVVGVGGIVGGLLARRFIKRLGMRRLMVIYSLGTVPWVVLALWIQPVVALSALLCIGAIGTMGDVIIVQSVKVLDADIQGRASSISFFGFAVGSLIGAFSGTQVTAGNFVVVFLTIGIVSVVISSVALMVYLRLAVSPKAVLLVEGSSPLEEGSVSHPAS